MLYSICMTWDIAVAKKTMFKLSLLWLTGADSYNSRRLGVKCSVSGRWHSGSLASCQRLPYLKSGYLSSSSFFLKPTNNFPSLFHFVVNGPAVRFTSPPVWRDRLPECPFRIGSGFIIHMLDLKSMTLLEHFLESICELVLFSHLAEGFQIYRFLL